jgi:hypothetical protein
MSMTASQGAASPIRHFNVPCKADSQSTVWTAVRSLAAPSSCTHTFGTTAHRIRGQRAWAERPVAASFGCRFPAFLTDRRSRVSSWRRPPCRTGGGAGTCGQGLHVLYLAAASHIATHASRRGVATAGHNGRFRGVAPRLGRAVEPFEAVED